MDQKIKRLGTCSKMSQMADQDPCHRWQDTRIQQGLLSNQKLRGAATKPPIMKGIDNHWQLHGGRVWAPTICGVRLLRAWHCVRHCDQWLSRTQRDSAKHLLIRWKAKVVCFEGISPIVHDVWVGHFSWLLSSVSLLLGHYPRSYRVMPRIFGTQNPRWIQGGGQAVTIAINGVKKKTYTWAKIDG